MTQPAPVATGRGKPTTAAVMFLVMFLASASMMVWSGLQLYHGEQLPATQTQSGIACDWVVQISAPADADRAWAELAQKTELPADVTPILATLRPVVHGLAQSAINTSQPWMVCAAPDGWVLTVGAGPGEKARTEAAVRSVIGALPGMGTLTPERLAVVEENGVVRVAVSRTTPAQTLLPLARPVLGQKDGDLGTFEPFRAAVERVGAGAMHLFVPAATAQRWAKPWLSDVEALGDIQWFGLGLRLDSDRLRLHGQVGVGQRGAAWLKGLVDVAALDDVGAWIAADADAGAVVRVPPKTRHLWAAHYGPASTWLPQLMAQPGTDAAKTLVWQRKGDAEAGVWTADVPAMPGLHSELVEGKRVVATRPEMLTHVRDVIRAAQPSQEKSGDRDRTRLWTHTQGWFAGPVQVDWVWTDAGLAGEIAWLTQAR